jgi:hypothetical protein
LFGALLVTACAPLSIDPPTPEKPTLLVLPAEIIRDAHSTRFGFAYAYEISSDDRPGSPYTAVFKLSVKNDMVIIDSLPPGNYTISRLLILPVGSGDKSYNTEGWPLNYKLRLEAGKITIFPHSLRVRTYNEIPGRGMETTYSTDIRRVTAQQKNKILDKLGALPNFSAWEVLGEKGTSTSSSRVGGHGKKYIPAANLQGSWSGIWRPLTAVEDTSCSEGRLNFDIDGSSLSGEGADGAGNLYQISASLIGDGIIRGKISLNRVRVAKVTGKLYDKGTILGSFEYGNECMAEWKARKN